MIAARDIEAVLPLTPMQEGMLFGTLYEPGGGAYVEQAAYRVSGDLDVARLEAAWRRVIERHQPLRAAFFWEGREDPLQVSFRAAPLPLALEDWSHLAAAEQDRRLESLLEQDRRRGFDLERPPLMRLTLARLADARHLLLWSHHHLILDGWSVARLLVEVLVLYAAEGSGGEADLPPPFPYREFVGWLQAREVAAEEAHWRRVLGDLSEPSRLPVIAPRQEPRSGAAEEVRRVLDEAETARLEEACRAGVITLNTLAQGALGLVVSRYTGSRDVVFGVTVAGRPEDLPGVERAVGLFINTLPLRLDVDPSLAAAEYLRRVQQRAAGDRDHGYSALPRIQAWSGVASGQPLFETVLVFENYPRPDDVAIPGLGLELEDVRLYEQTDYPLTLVVVPGDRLALAAAYDAGRMEAAAVEALLGHLRQTLLWLATAGDSTLAAARLLAPDEERQVVESFNGPRCSFAAPDCLHERFLRQAERTPQAVAVTGPEGSLTYRQLATAAGRLARRLVAAGAGPEVPVGVFLPRGLDLVVALLGILRSGAAYLPLDPEYPAQRLCGMLIDSGAPLLVTHPDLRHRLPESAATVVEVAPGGADGVPAEDVAGGDPALPRTDPENLAYVIYTSGSTGLPKGVAVTHRNVSRLFDACDAHFDFGPGDVWTLFHSYAFDFSVWELWGALLYGGRLVVVSHATSRSPADFARLLRDEAVTCLSQTPSAFRQLTALDGAEAGGVGPALRWVVFGGEALDPGALQPWFQRRGDRGPTLVNMYGITETTVHVTWRQVAAADAVGGASPIGVPLPDLRTYVLDRSGGPSPVVVPGEIHVGGDGLARGYLARPGLTADRFRPDPFSDRPGGRLYRTGDLARWSRSGELEYLGRVDHQVKIRGFRVELGEVEAALRELPEVGEAVVLADRDASGSVRLLGYASPAPPFRASELDAAALRQALRRRLPEHMVPGRILAVEELPRTPTGKLDRRGLAAAEPVERASGRFRPPRGPVEEAVAEMWADLLGVPRVGLGDSFFDLGGHSLLATRLLSRLRRAFQVELPLRSLFDRPTVEEVAAEVEALLAAAHRPGQRGKGDPDAGREASPPLVPVARDGDLPLSFAQERFWFLERLVPGDPAHHVHVLLELEGELDVPRLARTLSALVARHEALRTAFDEIDGEPVQRVEAPRPVPLSVVDLRALPAPRARGQARRQGRRQARRRFHLASGLLLRACLLRLAPRRALVALTLHHIACDGWSMGVLVRDVEALYRAEGGSERRSADSLPPLPVQYPDFAVWQRRRLRGERLERELAHWRTTLGGRLPPPLALPAASPGAERARPGARLHRFRVPPDLMEDLRGMVRRRGATLFMVLLSVFEVLLSRYAGTDRVWVGVPIAGRDRLETEGLIGLFLNTLLIEGDLSGDPSFRDLLERTRAALLEAYAHQELPYEHVARELGGGSAAVPVRPQILFLLHNHPLPDLELPGLRLRPLPLDRQGAQAELALEMEERDGTLHGVLVCPAGRFEPAALAGLCDHLLHLLEGFLRTPSSPLSQVPLQWAAAAPGRFTSDLEAW